ncbi:MAG TPA: CapA family protein [Streptosporangiaceae bacterium]|nr:CapA family protein [Streptosporangiaceae bacterium]
MHSARHTTRRRRQGQFRLAVVALIVVVLIGGYAVYRYEGHRHSGAADHTHSGRVTTDQKQKKGHKGQNGKNGRAKHGSPLSPNWRGDGKAVTLAFGGDVHFEGAIGARLSANPNTALDSVGRLLSGADLSMTNFESALTNGDCPSPQPKQFVFHSPKTALTAFKAAHVTVVTEANNHGEDCGRAGLEESLAITKEAGYPVLGIGKNAAQAFAPYETTINGQRIAIIAATEVIDTNLISSWTATATQPGLASAYQEGELVSAVQRARKVSDTVVVYLHWGTEAQLCPNTVQEPLAKALVKAGADIIIGAHAHVQLGAGYLGTAFVDYGLGNLAFYDTMPPETYSGALHITITGRHVDGFSWRPAEISGGLPIQETGSAAAEAIARWKRLRGCTDLSLTPGTALATADSETKSFTGPYIHPLGG